MTGGRRRWQQPGECGMWLANGLRVRCSPAKQDQGSGRQTQRAGQESASRARFSRYRYKVYSELVRICQTRSAKHDINVQFPRFPRSRVNQRRINAHMPNLSVVLMARMTSSNLEENGDSQPHIGYSVDVSGLQGRVVEIQGVGAQPCFALQDARQEVSTCVLASHEEQHGRRAVSLTRPISASSLESADQREQLSARTSISPIPESSVPLMGSVSVPFRPPEEPISQWLPQVRSGMASAQGSRASMEDAHVAIDDLSSSHADLGRSWQPGAFYAVCDGHDGAFAAEFVCRQLLGNLLEDPIFPTSVCGALNNAFLRTDSQLEAAWRLRRSQRHSVSGFCREYDSLNSSTGSCTSFMTVSTSSNGSPAFPGNPPSTSHASDTFDATAEGVKEARANVEDLEAANVDCGTTAISALLLGSSLYIANVGDSRAVLSRQGKAVELSKDHRPQCSAERKRVEAAGGSFASISGEGDYLNGHLAVTRALGNWHLENMKAKLADSYNTVGPLIAQPDVREVLLSPVDEFLVLACDGLWDSLQSNDVVKFVRNKLVERNDPQHCAEELVKRALKEGATDNVTVVIVCFNDKPPQQLSPRFRHSMLRKSASSASLTSA